MLHAAGLQTWTWIVQADQEGLKDACRQADERRTKLQLDAEALELRSHLQALYLPRSLVPPSPVPSPAGRSL